MNKNKIFLLITKTLINSKFRSIVRERYRLKKERKSFFLEISICKKPKSTRFSVKYYECRVALSHRLILHKLYNRVIKDRAYRSRIIKSEYVSNGCTNGSVGEISVYSRRSRG